MEGIGTSKRIENLKQEYPQFREHIPQLKERQRFVIERRLQGQTLATIAAEIPRAAGGFGVSSERIWQIEAKASRILYRLAMEKANRIKKEAKKNK